ncbi:MAG: hypothetical protein UW89_C0010G0003 [Parcubacteria group bacterium GW2011_GWB1_45_10]|nr:MAG: hypothetical protein UW89_C0010G0003 [Parcubacteria group bacterium GW2011_GWB1_45_10]
MRGDYLFSVLKSVGEGLDSFVVLSEAVLTAGYGATGKRIDYEVSKIKKQRTVSALERKRKQRLSSVLWKLKRDKLIEVNPETRAEKRFPLCHYPSPTYKTFRGKTVKIVLFDIKEKERAKRIWLCSALKNLGFRMLQKSAWAGENMIPKRLILDLDKLEILGDVEILEVLKPGSLKENLREIIDRSSKTS